MAVTQRNSILIGASPRAHARVAGLVGMAMLASGSFATFVGSRLIVPADALATTNRIAGSEVLFRFGIAANLAMMIAWLFYALLLYRLLRPVNERQAMAMVALVVVSVPIYMFNQTYLFAVLPIASGEQHEQLRLFLSLYRFGNSIAAIFFGLWLFPLGLLVLRSGFLPRALGILLLLGTPGYLVLFVQAFFFPGSERTLWGNPFLAVTHVSELALLLWLCFRGANAELWEKRAAETDSERR